MESGERKNMLFTRLRASEAYVEVLAAYKHGNDLQAEWGFSSGWHISLQEQWKSMVYQSSWRPAQA